MRCNETQTAPNLGSVRGVVGVLRKDGLTLEQMAQRLRKEPEYSHIRNTDDLVDLLHTAVFGTTDMQAQGVPLSMDEWCELVGPRSAHAGAPQSISNDQAAAFCCR
jgi:hypothetical protein